VDFDQGARRGTVRTRPAHEAPIFREVTTQSSSIYQIVWLSEWSPARLSRIAIASGCARMLEYRCEVERAAPT